MDSLTKVQETEIKEFKLYLDGEDVTDYIDGAVNLVVESTDERSRC